MQNIKIAPTFFYNKKRCWNKKNAKKVKKRDINKKKRTTRFLHL